MDSPQSPARPSGLSPGHSAAAKCNLSGCSERAILELDLRPLCLEHLVSHCYFRLQECEQGDGFEPPAGETRAQVSAEVFLQECHSKIASVLIAGSGFTNIDRARLLDILLWASELTEKRRKRWPRRGTAAGMRGE